MAKLIWKKTKEAGARVARGWPGSLPHHEAVVEPWNGWSAMIVGVPSVSEQEDGGVWVSSRSYPSRREAQKACRRVLRGAGIHV